MLIRLNKAVNLAAGNIVRSNDERLVSREHLLSMNTSYYLTKVICAAQTNIGKRTVLHMCLPANNLNGLI